MTELSNSTDKKHRWAVQIQVPLPDATLTIKPLYTLEEMNVVEELQRKIWGYGDQNSGYPYPARCLFEFAESGGLIGGAYLHNEMIGFSVAWLGRDREGVDYLHSQLLGILTGIRGSGVGYHMKLYQRQYVQHMKLDLMKWTFDPLQSRNANLNIRKLGAVIRTYVPNYYGQLQSNFSSGLSTDRFLVEWHVSAPRVNCRLEGVDDHKIPLSECQSVTDVEASTSGLKQVTGIHLNYTDTCLKIEIPSNFDHLRHKDLPLAQDWQLKIRDAFLHYFNNGYIIEDFVLEKDGASQKAFYVITKKPLDKILAAD